MKIIVYGGEGWIGRQFCDIINNTTNHTLILGTRRSIPENETDFTHIFSFIGEIGVSIGAAHITYIGNATKLTETNQGPNILHLNIGIPINGIRDPDNHMTKIIKLGIACVGGISISVLPELLPLSVILGEMKVCGTINLVNPGFISRSEILELYKDIVDIDFKPIKVTNQEKRVNNYEGNGDLSLYFPYIPAAKDSIGKLLIGYEKHAINDCGFINQDILNHIM